MGEWVTGLCGYGGFGGDGFIVSNKKIFAGIKKAFREFKKIYIFAPSLSRGVIGNTSDSGSEESRFEP
jgi:hypothetical protein